MYHVRMVRVVVEPLWVDGCRSRTFEKDIVAAARVTGRYKTRHQSEVLDAVVQHAIALLLLLLLLKVRPATRAGHTRAAGSR